MIICPKVDDAAHQHLKNIVVSYIQLAMPHEQLHSFDSMPPHFNVDEKPYAVILFVSDGIVELSDFILKLIPDSRIPKFIVWSGPEGKLLGRSRNKLTSVTPKNVESVSVENDFFGIQRMMEKLATWLAFNFNMVAANAIPELVSYYEMMEPRVTGYGSSQGMNFAAARAYEIALHLFSYHDFLQIVAIDLAPNRWKEIITEDGRVVNYSLKLLDAIKGMFADKRCGQFKRLVFYTDRQRKDNELMSALDSLANYDDVVFPEQTAYNGPTKRMVTKVKPLPAIGRTLDKVIKLGDFLAFETKDKRKFAIQEVTQKSPDDHINRPECRIVTDDCDDRFALFEQLWS